MQSKMIMRRQIFLLSALIVGTLAAGCAAEKLTTGAFREVNRLETELKRGVSTKADIERVLGAPNGSGHAVLPRDPRPREVWYYEDTEITGSKSLGYRRELGAEFDLIMRDIRQRVLLVFFEKEVFDGFMWYSTVGPAVEK